MIAVPKTVRASFPGSPEQDTNADAFVNHLRFLAMGCRAKPRADLFEACALLQTNRVRALEAYSEALVRTLGDSLGQNVRLHAPGTNEQTFDEKWLRELRIAHLTQDGGSLHFLLASRITPANRRLVKYLIAEISDHFPMI